MFCVFLLFIGFNRSVCDMFRWGSCHLAACATRLRQSCCSFFRLQLCWSRCERACGLPRPSWSSTGPRGGTNTGRNENMSISIMGNSQRGKTSREEGKTNRSWERNKETESRTRGVVTLHEICAPVNPQISHQQPLWKGKSYHGPGQNH